MSSILIGVGEDCNTFDIHKLKRPDYPDCYLSPISHWHLVEHLYHLQRGIFPCFLLGLNSDLFSKDSRARTSLGLVCAGSMISSIIPLDAASYGFANFSLYSFISFVLNFSLSSSVASANWSLYIMLTAASGPITAISAVGHA